MRTLDVSLSLALLAACGNVQGTPPDAPPIPTEDFSLALLTTTASVPLDGKSRVEVEITRSGGFAGEVMIGGVTLPSGVTVTPATIAANATTAEVIVSGAAPLTIGEKVTFTLEGTATGTPSHQVMVSNASVTGQPGALDNQFGAGATGLATISFGSDDGGAFNRIDVIAGNIFVTGSGTGGLGEVRMSSTRFTAAGVIDPTWVPATNPPNPLARSNFQPSGSNDFANAVATGRGTDGLSIIIGTNRNGSSSPDIGIIKYKLNGNPVGPEFGTGQQGGQSQIDLQPAGSTEDVRTGVVLGDSSIIAAGSTNGHWMVAGITAQGTLNTGGFAAPTGFERLVIGQSSTATSAVADSVGRLVVAGTFTMAGQTDALIIRYRADGAHDPTFGAAGQVVIAGPANESAVSLRAANGKLLLATAATDTMGSSFYRIRRYSEDGAVDMTFGRDGLAELPASGALMDFAVATDGSLILLTDEGGKAGLTKLTRKGELDTLYGAAGTGSVQIFIGDGGSPRAIQVYDADRMVFSGGNMGGVPGPGTFGVAGRVWR